MWFVVLVLGVFCVLALGTMGACFFFPDFLSVIGSPLGLSGSVWGLGLGWDSGWDLGWGLHAWGVGVGFSDHRESTFPDPLLPLSSSPREARVASVLF